MASRARFIPAYAGNGAAQADWPRRAASAAAAQHRARQSELDVELLELSWLGLGLLHPFGHVWP